ncbi:RNA polymerase sigma factor [Sphingomonas sp. H39-1-10]|uniref:RNA polymerase sigma factor n=1 Tax=Sphingomonas TaxID=13687 RepID=UPI00088B63BE|nr:MULTISPECIES: RNA polymerase sigma factor [Sphingomonas]MDF0487873.1 RNA polymerase sigma factor [Sphingomonas pollutisoli]SDA24660.1 RNA polymerase sigma-70 factor, ECF subfamily [Sphingomonas sp. NFR15]
MISLVQPLIPALRRYARALLRDREDADDLVQDVLERAIARWAQRREAASVRAWLFTILHNLALDRLRQGKRRGTAEPIDTLPEGRLATPARQDAAIARDDILALVAALPEEQRTVMLLVGVEELSYAEAALILDVPMGTVMSRLSRARERLRRMLAGESVGARPALRIVS